MREGGIEDHLSEQGTCPHRVPDKEAVLPFVNHSKRFAELADSLLDEQPCLATAVQQHHPVRQWSGFFSARLTAALAHAAQLHLGFACSSTSARPENWSRLHEHWFFLHTYDENKCGRLLVGVLFSKKVAVKIFFEEYRVELEFRTISCEIVRK
jgi:hypothetical protein